MLSLQGRKEKYAVNRAYTKGNILIDDKPKNIQKWIDKGGIGILYQANQDSLDYLYDRLEKYYKE
jgi:5'(3')-deoxyribonucleotidase